ncbi:hypothetical protein AG1IA_08792 [Rhizoctonia solani AG-1 IA]|uniref:Uncharacterized protein n=1 Tax=Thanatephorus cucumeris (strain AG1-IA) TaxID=983506 RepID=L8WG65_THACA|nr:hypothetical protein AG1IA_08792 [Rhizoctonia solani AG-1 IA]
MGPSPELRQRREFWLRRQKEAKVRRYLVRVLFKLSSFKYFGWIIYSRLNAVGKRKLSRNLL